MRHALKNHRRDLATIASWAMFSRGLEPEFSDAVQQELKQINEPALETGSSIKNLTALPWCSIDNDDSRDLDQLTACEILPKGGVRIFVAVADVDALVKKGSAIDNHARLNTTSVYTSACTFPMLPEKLCTDLTSLNPHQDRMALVTAMDFSDLLRQNFDAFLDQTGSKEWGNRRQQGVVVDDALKTLAKRMDNKVNALYKRAKKSGETAEPVSMDPLVDGFTNDDGEFVRGLNLLRAERNSAPVISGLADEMKVRELATGSLANGTLKFKRPITLDEAEELRKAVNRLAKQNEPNDLRVAGELKDLIDKATENSGGEAYKASRAARKEVGDKFERISLVKKLVGMKPGTTDRQVALENVVETAVTSGTTSLDDIKALKSVLDDAGPRGQRAWRELQGATLEHIQNKAYRSQTDESGQRVLYPSQLEKVIGDLDKGGKLDFVFDKRTAELLRTMGEVSKDLFTAPPGSVNSSNTASAMTNAMDTLVTFMLSGAPIPAGKVSSGLINSLRSRGLRKEVNRLVSTEQN